MWESDTSPRCWNCNALLLEGFLPRPWSLKCHRCHKQNSQLVDNPPDSLLAFMEAQIAKVKP